MIHPSYKELMEKINEENASQDLPQITSRYSVVLATSKRARQLTNGATPLAEAKSGKPLSIAVEEFYEGKVMMDPEGQPERVEAATPEETEEAVAGDAEETAEEVTEEAAPEEEKAEEE